MSVADDPSDSVRQEMITALECRKWEARFFDEVFLRGERPLGERDFELWAVGLAESAHGA